MRNGDLEALLAKARGIVMTPADLEAQRRSFAYGNAAIENPAITRALIDEQADRLNAERSWPGSSTGRR